MKKTQNNSQRIGNNMEQMEGTSIIIKLFTLIFGFLFVLIGLFMILTSLEQTTVNGVIIYFLLGIIFLLIAILFVWRMLGRKLIYSSERIVIKGFLGSRTIYIENIASIGNIAVRTSRGGIPVSITWLELHLKDQDTVKLDLNAFSYPASMNFILVLKKYLGIDEAASESATELVCKKCGSSLPPGVTFCTKCGIFVS
ncbi:MAG: zinc-ribbon domain-containing protein [Promethearchaeota archaeon]